MTTLDDVEVRRRSSEHLLKMLVPLVRTLFDDVDDDARMNFVEEVMTNFCRSCGSDERKYGLCHCEMDD